MDVFSIAKEYEARGRFDLAVMEYDKLVEAGTAGIDGLMRRAALFRERGDLVRAIADLGSAGALAPDDPWPKLRLGEIANSVGRNIIAANYMRRAMEVAPDLNEARVNVAHIYYQLGYLDLAYSVARSLPEELPDWWARARKEAVTAYKERRAAALQFLRTLPQRGGLDRETRWRVCQDLFALGRLELARKICETLVQEGPRSPPAFYFLARIITRQYGVSAALSFLQSSDTIHDDLPNYPIQIGLLMHEAGRSEDALEQYNRPAVRGLDSEEIRWARFCAMFILGQRGQLLEYCREWLREAPDSLAPAGYLAASHSEREEANAITRGSVIALKSHIMQFWDAEAIPSDIADVMQGWVRAHPHAKHYVFNEKSARAFLIEHYGEEISHTFDLCHHPAMKSDYFRLAFLYQAGGVYIDADESCLQPIDDVLEAANDAEIIAILSGGVPGYLLNGFLGNRPRSSIMRSALEHTTLDIRRRVQAGSKPDIWLATGPGLITRTVGHYLAQRTQVEERTVLLMPLQQYRTRARTESGLAYKTNLAANWQLA